MNNPEIENLVHVAILMAQELQEFVDDAKEAVEGGYQEDPLQATQELLKDWEAAYRLSGHRPAWQDQIAQQGSDSEMELNI
jgi:hypothetical protein